MGSGSEAAQSELQDKYHKASGTLFLSPHRAVNNITFFFLVNLLEYDITRSSLTSAQSSETSDGGETRCSQCSTVSGRLKHTDVDHVTLNKLLQVTKENGFEILDEARLSTLIEVM